MRTLIVTDAWAPQTNGVVTTLTNVIACIERSGNAVTVIEPSAFRVLPCPKYPEIRLAADVWRLGGLIDRLVPETIHVATEGPLGLAARLSLCRRLLAFTTSLHTKFPEYVSQRLPVPLSGGYRYLRWFHRPAVRTLVTTASHRRELEQRGLRDLVVWGRGVDTHAFRPLPREPRAKPRLLYVGRVSMEKNIEAFLRLRTDAEKVVVGDGPQRAQLQRQYPNARWLGYRYGEALVKEYAAADAFVFPSRTDTFGLVMLEALACGTPVAAYPVTGPVDVLTPAVGAMHEDLAVAANAALKLNREDCRRFACQNDWNAIAAQFLESLVPAAPPRLQLANARGRAASRGRKRQKIQEPRLSAARKATQMLAPPISKLP